MFRPRIVRGELQSIVCSPTYLSQFAVTISKPQTVPSLLLGPAVGHFVLGPAVGHFVLGPAVGHFVLGPAVGHFIPASHHAR